MCIHQLDIGYDIFFLLKKWTFAKKYKGKICFFKKSIFDTKIEKYPRKQGKTR